jgi:heme A synthase
MLASLLGPRPRRVKVLGVVLLVAVIGQGLLGGFRVLLDRYLGPNLALIHGCFAQIVFGLTVVMAVITGRAYVTGLQSGAMPLAGPRLRRVTLLVVALVYTQIVFGALLRHTYSPFGPRGHLLVAFAVVAGVGWVVKEVWEHHRGDRALTVPAMILAHLVGFQLLMGVEAWMLRYTSTGAGHQIGVRTVHVLLGSLIFAASITLALQTRRGVVPAVVSAPADDAAPGLGLKSTLLLEGVA